jgi:putative transposase
VFAIHRSSYRAWCDRPTELSAEESQLREQVQAAHALSNGSAGARSIASMVTTAGTPLSRYRASRRMKLLGLVSSQLPAHQYKKADQPHVSVPNRLDRQFEVASPNQVWAGDITYVWTGKRWAYLAMVMDLYARRPVGWALSLSANSELTRKALTMAYESRGNPPGVLFHSDRGCQYTNLEFRQQVWRFQMVQSMSRRGNCWDNRKGVRAHLSLI